MAYGDRGEQEARPGTVKEPDNWWFHYPWEIVRVLFSLWDANERSPEMLMSFWALFNHDLCFIDDIVLCCNLLEFQRKRKVLEETFDA